MSWPTDEDLMMFRRMPESKRLKLFFSHIKNLWRVDGLYFLGIEAKFGTEAAAEIDADCWRVMGKLEAREIREALDIKKNDVQALIQALNNTTWALYQNKKEYEASPQHGIYRVVKCVTQETRLKKGLREFPCKQVRFGYLQRFAREFNPDIKVACRVCPPDARSEGKWCEWEFTLQK